MAQAWLIASGKGGVGKSTLTTALGMALARSGQRVCIVDGDIGLRDQDALLGLENNVVYDLVDVANNACRLPQALISPPGLDKLSLLPASQFARAKELSAKAFTKVLTALKEQFDHVLIDCPAGIERGLRGLMVGDVDRTVIVCTADDVCIRNAERAASVMEKKQLPRPEIIVNRLQADLIRAGEMYSAQTVAQTLDLSLLGEVPEEPMVTRAMLRHVPLMDVDCPARDALNRIARRMQGEEAPLPAYGSEKLSWFKRHFGHKLKEVKPIDC